MLHVLDVYKRQAYKTVAQSMEGKKVVIRTMDMGADKQVDYFRLPKEENPAMGYRCLLYTSRCV